MISKISKLAPLCVLVVSYSLLIASCTIQPTKIPGEVATCPLTIPVSQGSFSQIQCETISDPDTWVKRSFMLSAADERVKKYVEEANRKSALYNQGIFPPDTEMKHDEMIDSLSPDSIEASLQIPAPEQALTQAINVAFSYDAASTIYNIDRMAYDKRIASGEGVCQFPSQLMEQVFDGDRFVQFPNGLSYFFKRFWIQATHTDGKANVSKVIQKLKSIPYVPSNAINGLNIPLPTDATSAVLYHDINAPKAQMLIIFEKYGCAEELAIINPIGMVTTEPGTFLMMPNEFTLPLLN